MVRSPFKRSILLRFTLLRGKPRLRAEVHYGAQARVFRPWMNVMRVPYEALEERSGVCFGGFRPPKHVEEPWALARGPSLSLCWERKSYGGT